MNIQIEVVKSFMLEEILNAIYNLIAACIIKGRSIEIINKVKNHFQLFYLQVHQDYLSLVRF